MCAWPATAATCRRDGKMVLYALSPAGRRLVAAVLDEVAR
jgi:hypothetical protein